MNLIHTCMQANVQQNSIMQENLAIWISLLAAIFSFEHTNALIFELNLMQNDLQIE